MAEITVFQGEREESWPVPPGITLSQALSGRGFRITLPCGGLGTCGGCRVKAEGKLSPPSPREQEALSERALAAGWRLACQAEAMGDVRVYLPARADGSARTSPGRVRPEPGASLGAAVDLGTTTLAARLVDLRCGEQLAEMVAVNPQIAMGADLITRIQRALTSEGREALRAAILRGINELLRELAESLNAAPDRIEALTIAGNSVMHHLLLGLSVAGLSAAPFVPSATAALSLPARRVGLKIRPEATVYLFPLIGGFVGGDAVAGLLATDLASQAGAVLLVDLGTNGEVLLSVDGKIWAASTAAGPAFEGGEIAWGMRAEAGAIVDLRIDEGWRLVTVGGERPRGIAGSGLVRIVAELLSAGILGPEGRLRAAEELGGEQRRKAAGRLGQGKDGLEVVLAPEEGIVLTQKDIRRLQLAKGAVRSAAEILLHEAGVAAEDLRRIYLAGAFGSGLDPESVLRVGLLPEVSPERLSAVGNASLDGATKALLSQAERAEGESLAGRAKHVALETRPYYPDKFVEALAFPRSAPDRRP